jgi:hypothetical protein
VAGRGKIRYGGWRRLCDRGIGLTSQGTINPRPCPRSTCLENSAWIHALLSPRLDNVPMLQAQCACLISSSTRIDADHSGPLRPVPSTIVHSLSEPRSARVFALLIDIEGGKPTKRGAIGAKQNNPLDRNMLAAVALQPLRNIPLTSTIRSGQSRRYRELSADGRHHLVNPHGVAKGHSSLFHVGCMISEPIEWSAGRFLPLGLGVL